MRSADKHRLALRLLSTGNRDEAQALLRDAIVEEETTELWNDWAAVQYARGEAGDAEAGFRVALELAPGDLEASLNLAALLSAAGRFSELLEVSRLAQTGGASARDLAALGALRGQAERALTQDPSSDETFLQAYLAKFASEDDNERAYFNVHVHRFAATLAALPNAKPKMRVLELGAAFHHQSPALQRWKGYQEVRCSDV